MVEVRVLTGEAIDAHAGEIAALRQAVFRDWPYLYDGALEHEVAYVRQYRDMAGALLVAAFDLGRLVGASTSTPLEGVSDEFAVPFTARGIAVQDVLWGPESALLPAYRGQGIGQRFFTLREAHARGMGRGHVAFASILRPDSHPARPAAARTNDAFWHRQGYAPLPGVVVEFEWRDVGDATESRKPLQVWHKRLDQA
jgi:GNAT superfamily N-acetyltransferase